MYVNYPIFTFTAPGLCVRHGKAFLTPRLFLKSKQKLFRLFLGTFFKKHVKPLIYKEKYWDPALSPPKWLAYFSNTIIEYPPFLQDSSMCCRILND